MKPDTYPKDLPKIPIYNDLEACLDCDKVTLELPGKPDFNHCYPMVDPNYSLDKLTPKQGELYIRISTEVRCPLYVPKK